MQVVTGMKIIKTKKAEWNLYFSYNKNTPVLGFTSCYVLPTIEYFRDRSLDENGDCSCQINFHWIFWTITLARYWGSAYEKRR